MMQFGMQIMQFDLSSVSAFSYPDEMQLFIPLSHHESLGPFWYAFFASY